MDLDVVRLQAELRELEGQRREVREHRGGELCQAEAQPPAQSA